MRLNKAAPKIAIDLLKIKTADRTSKFFQLPLEAVDQFARALPLEMSTEYLRSLLGGQIRLCVVHEERVVNYIPGLQR